MRAVCGFFLGGCGLWSFFFWGSPRSVLPDKEIIPFSVFYKPPTMKDTSIARKRNITFRYDISSSLAAAGIPNSPAKQKKLRRLPHVFCRVLELPFNSDVPVAVEESRECFRFVVSSDFVFEEARLQVIEIFTGVTKVVVVGGANRLRIPWDEAELDTWRFRLPASTLPELSSVVYSDGELVVTVPKAVISEEDDEGTLIEAGDEELGAENGCGRDTTRTGCSSEYPNEKGSDTGKFEEQVIYNSESRLSNGRGSLTLMRPGIPAVSLVAVQ